MYNRIKQTQDVCSNLLVTLTMERKKLCANGFVKKSLDQLTVFECEGDRCPWHPSGVNDQKALLYIIISKGDKRLHLMHCILDCKEQLLFIKGVLNKSKTCCSNTISLSAAFMCGESLHSPRLKLDGMVVNPNYTPNRSELFLKSLHNPRGEVYNLPNRRLLMVYLEGETKHKRQHVLYNFDNVTYEAIIVDKKRKGIEKWVPLCTGDYFCNDSTLNSENAKGVDTVEHYLLEMIEECHVKKNVCLLWEICAVKICEAGETVIKQLPDFVPDFVGKRVRIIDALLNVSCGASKDDCTKQSCSVHTSK